MTPHHGTWYDVMLLTDIIPSDVSTMTGKYRTAVARGIPLLHSITLSMIDKEIIYSTWQSVSESGIYKVGILSYSKRNTVFTTPLFIYYPAQYLLPRDTDIA